MPDDDAWGKIQEILAIKGVLLSPFCFFSRLAAFFSFGVILGCFFGSLPVRLDFDIMIVPDRLCGTRGGSETGCLPVMSKSPGSWALYG